MANRVTTTGSFGYQNAQKRNFGAGGGSGVKRIPMFHQKGLFAEFLNTKQTVSGVILPAFDPSVDEQDAYRPSSVGSYRTDDGIFDEDGNFPLSAWSVALGTYSFFGKSMQHFVSPRVLNRPDPIVDLRKYIYDRSQSGDTSLNYLRSIPQNANWREYTVALPDAQPMVYLNYWGTGTNPKAQDVNTVKNRVLVIKGAVWKAIETDLNKERPASVTTPRDADWPQYLYGDVTHPAHALEFTSQVREFVSHNNKSYTSAALSFGSLVGNPAGGKLLQCKTVRIPEEALTGRYDLADCDNCIYIPSYEEITQMLVDDGLVPHWLIKEVCVPNCKTPITFPGEEPEETYQEATPATHASAPVMPAAGAAPVMPTAAPAQPVQTVQTVRKGSLFQEDPDDDIPMGDPAPVPAATTAAPAPTSSLTAAEEAELQSLLAILNTNPGQMTPDSSTRLSQLLSKQYTK